MFQPLEAVMDGCFFTRALRKCRFFLIAPRLTSLCTENETETQSLRWTVRLGGGQTLEGGPKP